MLIHTWNVPQISLICNVNLIHLSISELTDEAVLDTSMKENNNNTSGLQPVVLYLMLVRDLYLVLDSLGAILVLLAVEPFRE